MTEEDFAHNPGDWFVLCTEPVTFDGLAPIMLDGVEKHQLYMKIKGPEGLADMFIPANEPGSPTQEDWKITTWMCNALNHAKQRTEDVLEELNLGDEEDAP